MKKIYIFITLLLSSASFAQSFSCGTLPEDIDQPYYNRSASDADNVKYVFNIYFFLITDGEGNNNTGQSFGEPQVMEALYLLNKNFNAFNIFFK